MADETKDVPESDSDVLSDEELESIAGGQGGRSGKHPEPVRPMEPED